VELVCLHAPIRSRDTLVLKAAQSRRLETAGRPPAEGWHTHRVRRLLEEDSIDAEWAANSYQDDALDVYGAQRPVVFDPTLRDAVAPFLQQAPAGLTDQGSPETQAQRAAWQSEIVQNFLTNLHDDALSRTEWAVGLDAELGRARTMLADLEAQLTDRTAWAKSLDEELAGARALIAELETRVAERINWARSLEKELRETRGLIAGLETQIAERTAWAHAADAERERARAALTDLRAEFEKRTAWAWASDAEKERAWSALADLRSEFEKRTAWAFQLQQELAEARAEISSSQLAAVSADE
jgi:hypothetical protein